MQESLCVKEHIDTASILGDINKIARTSSTGTMSSNEDVDDGNVTSFETQSKIFILFCPVIEHNMYRQLVLQVKMHKSIVVSVTWEVYDVDLV